MDEITTVARERSELEFLAGETRNSLLFPLCSPQPLSAPCVLAWRLLDLAWTPGLLGVHQVGLSPSPSHAWGCPQRGCFSEAQVPAFTIFTGLG